MSSAGDSVGIVIARRRRSAAKLSLTPLVDCVFILLIFFMLQSNLLEPHSLPVQATKPDEQATAVAENDRPSVLYVELHADGSAWVDGVRHDAQSLPQALRAASLDEVESAIVASDPGVSLQRAVDVVDALNARGLARVALREAKRFE